MSKAQQVKINILLSEKLANFLVANPNILNKYSGSSYVVFSPSNKKLNEMNLKLVDELKKEGKRVIKASKTTEQVNSWTFTSVV